METALLDMPIVWPKHAIAVNANLVRPIKPLISIPPLLLICQQTPLSNDELLVLSCGLTFCPTLKRTNLAELSADINDFTRLMRLKKYTFMITITALNLTNTTCFIKSSWTPSTDRDPALNTYVDAIKHDILTANRNHITDNLTKDEQALRNLKKRQEILNNQTCWQRLWNGCYGKILVHRRMQPTVNPRTYRRGGGGEVAVSLPIRFSEIFPTG